MSTYFYWQSEPGLWTVGYEDANGRKHPDSDWDRREDARNQVITLNGGTPPKKSNPFADPYKVNQIETLTDGGAYGYSVKIVCNANKDGTTWMHMIRAELEQILNIWKE